MVAAISRSEASRSRVLVQDENLRAALHSLEHAVLVPRDERPEIEHLDLEALLGELSAASVAV